LTFGEEGLAVAGTPVRKHIVETLELVGGEDYVFSRLAEGTPVARIAEELNVSRGMLYWWCNCEERKPAYRRARQAAAAALAEEGLAIADSATPKDAKVAALRIDQRRWLASLMDRENWSPNKGAQVQINVANLHLGALRHQPTGAANPVIEHDNSDLPDYLT
jgi:hypothetical protein